MTSYTWGFGVKFALEFDNLSTQDQDKILDFIDIYEEYGLSDFGLYRGKIAPSWKNLDSTDSNYQYARDNHLWHYHVGIPIYVKTHEKYQTSDYLLHFQWEGEREIRWKSHILKIKDCSPDEARRNPGLPPDSAVLHPATSSISHPRQTFRRTRRHQFRQAASVRQA